MTLERAEIDGGNKNPALWAGLGWLVEKFKAGNCAGCAVIVVGFLCHFIDIVAFVRIRLENGW